jgi:outer membrane protein, heavy metal efflux system
MRIIPFCTFSLVLLFSLIEGKAAGATAEESRPDTLTLSLAQAETRFIEENLGLIAARIQLDIADAEIRQARLWENPEVSIEHQIINRNGSGPIGFTSSDNTVFEIEQTIFTSGKRTRNIRLRELEKMEVTHAFDVLLRSIRRDLRETWFDFERLSASTALFDEQINGLRRMLTVFESQAEEGNIARLEVIRLRGLLLELQDERNGLLNDLDEAERSLQILLNLPGVPLRPEPSQRSYNANLTASLPDLQELAEMALEYRSDLQQSRAAMAVSRQQVRVEQAAARPDVSLGLVYDRLDGPVDNYWGMLISFDVPLFNRNQGAVRAARHELRQHELSLQQHQDAVIAEVSGARGKLLRAEGLQAELRTDDLDDFSEILQMLLRAYRNGELSLVAFIDYYESFREGVLRQLSVQNDWLNAIEELNYTVGRDLLSIP